MLKRFRLIDVYIDHNNEVVQVYELTPRVRTYVTMKPLEALKLLKHLEEIL